MRSLSTNSLFFPHDANNFNAVPDLLSEWNSVGAEVI